MKKSIGITAGVIVVLAGGWLGGTWYTGKRIETETQQRLGVLNEKLAAVVPGYTLRVDQLKYERGFFTTQARYGLSLSQDIKEESGTVTPLPLGSTEFDARFEHGPFPRSALASGQFLPQMAFVHAELARTELVKPLFELTKNAAPLWSDTIVSYSGNASTRSGLAPIDFTEDDVTLSFSGATLTGTFQRATRSGTARLDAEYVRFTADGDQDTQMSATGWSVDMRSHQGKHGFTLGESTMAIKRIAMIDKRESLDISLDDLSYRALATEDGDYIDIEAAYKTGPLTVNKIPFGSGELNVKASRLDGQALKALSDGYNQLLRGYFATGETDEGLKDEQLTMLIENGGRLLAGGPSLSLGPVAWRTEKGESSLMSSIVLVKPATTSGELTPREYLEEAVKAIDVKMVVSKPMVRDLAIHYETSQGKTPEEAAKEADETIDAFAGMAEILNIGRNDGDKLVGTFTYAAGVAKLNGRDVPVNELFDNLYDSASASLDDDDHNHEDDAAMSAEAASEAVEAAAEAAAAEAAQEAADAAAWATEGDSLRSVNAGLLTSILAEGGYDSTTEEGASGPVIVIDANGLPLRDLRAELYCIDDDECMDVSMKASFGKRKTSLKALNAWNQKYRWTRAYLDDDNQAVLRMDLSAEGGVGRENLSIMVNTFMQMVGNFEDEVYAAR
ncbi:DUF945 family protein [Bordetella bronchiseptica]|uniref:PF06097 family protein n=2 Tax=Bordetella bronchiseptica TaxID=518 RepID=A0ABR4RLX5_BORBO|nr:DUF945 family protein [Bordetella bronchiseptica]SHS91046.1 Bacterial protein of uncharacterised function (DUF945) [Mycobacteroides abscessus subsp. abscessus]AWP83351.1 hypothetical protein B7P00_04255 [Bordetella bronchiseptica]AWQ08920.1 hypothetical protein B9G72_04250 [Bordetella bronchiseptica]AXT90700.1 hypothetical protein CJ015_20120 [Bordetella bronchiseptica]AZW20522.1 hypothetical protein CS345_04210 [Bordetella bronchiseptica]